MWTTQSWTLLFRVFAVPTHVPAGFCRTLSNFRAGALSRNVDDICAFKYFTFRRETHTSTRHKNCYHDIWRAGNCSRGKQLALLFGLLRCMRLQISIAYALPCCVEQRVNQIDDTFRSATPSYYRADPTL